MLPSSLSLPHQWNFLLPLPAPDRISRFQVCFRFQSLSSKCFHFHKNLTASTASASSFCFHNPAQYETAKSGVEINFFNNLLVGQVISNAYLPKKISTCPKKIGTLSFEAVYFWKKICKMYFLAKTLNLHNTCILL